MKKFNIPVIKVLETTITVEAETFNEAIAKVIDNPEDMVISSLESDEDVYENDWVIDSESKNENEIEKIASQLKERGYGEIDLNCESYPYYVLYGNKPKDEQLAGPFKSFDEADKIANSYSEACYNYAYVTDKDGNRLYEEY